MIYREVIASLLPLRLLLSFVDFVVFSSPHVTRRQRWCLLWPSLTRPSFFLECFLSLEIKRDVKDNEKSELRPATAIQQCQKIHFRFWRAEFSYAGLTGQTPHSRMQRQTGTNLASFSQVTSVRLCDDDDETTRRSSQSLLSSSFSVVCRLW